MTRTECLLTTLSVTTRTWTWPPHSCIINKDLYVTVLDSPDVDDDLFEAFSIFSVKLLPMHQLVPLLSFGPIIVFSLLFILLVRIKSLLLSAHFTMCAVVALAQESSE